MTAALFEELVRIDEGDHCIDIMIGKMAAAEKSFSIVVDYRQSLGNRNEIPDTT